MRTASNLISEHLLLHDRASLEPHVDGQQWRLHPSLYLSLSLPEDSKAELRRTSR